MPISVEVWGDYACFSRPEMKVERVSYDVMTPSAARGLLEAIYWHPGLRWSIDRIQVCNPIRFTNIRRNEVKEKVSFPGVRAKMKDPDKDVSIYACDNSMRSQRSATILKNVRYGVEFHFELTGLKSDAESDGEKKHYNIIKRRLEKGQTFRTPCLGCSEFPVKSIKLVDEFDEGEISQDIKDMGDVDLGYMLHHLEFEDKGVPVNGSWDSPIFSDKAEAVYYRPHLIAGIIDVNRYEEESRC